jgi:hypothetical protein
LSKTHRYDDLFGVARNPLLANPTNAELVAEHALRFARRTAGELPVDSREHTMKRRQRSDATAVGIRGPGDRSGDLVLPDPNLEELAEVTSYLHDVGATRLHQRNPVAVVI